jgi:hypothetical protein
LCIINALGFHVLPSLTARRPNPGLFSAFVLYLPVSAWSYAAAAQDDLLTVPSVLGSAALGALTMVAPIIVLMLARRFHYPDAPPITPTAAAEGDRTYRTAAVDG